MLNDREQRALADLERQLSAADPRLSRWLRSGTTRSLAAPTLCTLGILLGLTLLVAGIPARLLLLSLAGVVLVGATGFFIADWLTRPRPLPAPAPPGTRQQKS